MQRSDNIGRLSNDAFDLIVIGGGITAACLAYDATRRGMRVALVEKADFGGATSASSSKLLHGGIRFLQQARPDKVRESAFERVFFQNLVPHHCRYMPFVIPAYRGLSKGRAALFAASVAYYAASLGQNRVLNDPAHTVEATSLIGRDRLRSLLPWITDDEKVTGALVLPECHMKSSERVTFSLIRGASELGATVANYVAATGLLLEGKTATGVSARDAVSGAHIEIKGKVVANCSGPWLSGFLPRKAQSAASPITAFSRGSHLVLRGNSLDCAVALPTKQKIQGVASRGGRHMFMIPWRQHTLVGTSYAAHEGKLDNVVPTDSDIDQLKSGINEAAGHELVSDSSIVHAYAGIYPLIAESVNNAVYQGTAEYRIIDHSKFDSIDGFVSVFGAKFTTARILAEKSCNLIASKTGEKFGPCTTRNTPVPTAEFGNFAAYLDRLQSRYADIASRPCIESLASSFGTDAIEVLELARKDPDLRLPLGDGRLNIAAEAVFCARNEMAIYLDDFIFRRSGVGTIGHPGTELLQRTSALMATELAWSEARRLEEIERTAARFPIPFRAA